MIYQERPMPRDNHFADGRALSVLLDRTLLALSAITTTFLFALPLYYSSYGLDLTDEGHYLNAIANPFVYAINSPPSLFGFVYHWPYLWVGEDIAVLRIVNVMLTMVLGWILTFLVIRLLWRVSWPGAAVLSAGMASLAWAGFSYFWVFTPNYNTLNIQSLFVVMIGVLLAHQPARIGQVLAGGLIGIGGWCCFMAKPTTAAAIALVVTVLFWRRKSLVSILSAALVALALLIVTVHAVDGGISGLVTRMVKSAEVETLLGMHEVSRMFRIDWLPTSRSQLAIAVLVAIAILFSALMGPTHKALSSLALAAGLITTIAIALLGADPISIKPSTLFLVPAFASLGAVFYRKGLVLRIHAPTSIALGLTFLVLPHLFALGSAYSYWISGSRAGLFWMLAVVVLLSPLAQERRSVATLLPLTVVAQLLTASAANTGMLRPFRQVKDLRAYTAVMPMPGSGKLVLSHPFHDYLTTARTQARAAGLEVGAPLIDLSGRSPGLLYMLETRALGLPWLIGQYPDGNAAMLETLGHPWVIGYLGTNAAAVKALGLENCADLAKAWVLIEPEGPRHLDHASVMASFGAGQADYGAAGTFETPVNDGDFPNAYRQLLLKPVRSVALAEQSCREARGKRSDNEKWSRW
ncbi:hypothetical protein E3H11_39135 [Bradyrhizobium brasilense]|uniref:hypothetical protein n=1 Tax=Bradyrhizobium brasilense TaxID=1419277 RepID=UPI0014573A18|nr:hypothetical protein [Bradyrhizobium brasilense]NLS74777.1 hypothetical protein [Bradyrhizobium brasilense]